MDPHDRQAEKAVRNLGVVLTRQRGSLERSGVLRASLTSQSPKSTFGKTPLPVNNPSRKTILMGDGDNLRDEDKTPLFPRFF
jgi:hypothetical protein